MKIGNKKFDVDNNAYIMGILNVTPDSFSDGGSHNTVSKALDAVEKMIKEGADIIDIGGESTRPGYVKISDDEEIDRVVPVIEAVKKQFDIPLSLDTYKSRVAEAGIKAGADLINDIWGLKYDCKMADLIAKNEVAVCLMHNRSESIYSDFIEDVIDDLKESIDIAHRAGIKKDKIIVDPGVGFAKSYEQNLKIINSVDRLSVLGYPILLGTSRKSVIGITLDVPVDERMVGTAATTAWGRIKGCSFFRVHDVMENAMTIKMIDSIKKGRCVWTESE